MRDKCARRHERRVRWKWNGHAFPEQAHGNDQVSVLADELTEMIDHCRRDVLSEWG